MPPPPRQRSNSPPPRVAATGLPAAAQGSAQGSAHGSTGTTAVDHPAPAAVATATEASAGPQPVMLAAADVAADPHPAVVVQPPSATQASLVTGPAAHPALATALDAGQAALPVTLVQVEAPVHTDTLEQLEPHHGGGASAAGRSRLADTGHGTDLHHLLHPAVHDALFAEGPGRPPGGAARATADCVQI